MACLIKVGGGKMPLRAIQFMASDGERRTIRLGRCGLEAAREFKRQVEILVSHAITNTPLDAATSAWLAGLPDRMHEKLAQKGLVAQRHPKPIAPSLGEWLETYLDQRTDVKPATRKALTRTKGLLIEHFGVARDIGTITVAAAKEWRAWLQTLMTKRIVNDETVEQPISEASVRHTIAAMPR